MYLTSYSRSGKRFEMRSKNNVHAGIGIPCSHMYGLSSSPYTRTLIGTLQILFSSQFYRLKWTISFRLVGSVNLKLVQLYFTTYTLVLHLLRTIFYNLLRFQNPDLVSIDHRLILTQLKKEHNLRFACHSFNWSSIWLPI